MVTNKSHKLVVRISENQLRWLSNVLIQEQRTKSEILRDALNKYLVENTHAHEIKEQK
jgi:metal-responsive CopG/Arc/MetJ family transcriptional regulator